VPKLEHQLINIRHLQHGAAVSVDWSVRVPSPSA
jgi:hypothetical protein